MSRLALQWPALVLTALALLPAATNAQTIDPYKNVVPSMPSPYWGYTYDPYGNRAAVIRATGELLVNKEKAKALNIENREKNLETRRKELEYFEWERDWNSDGTRKERDRIRKIESDRALKDTPLSEIYSGRALNTLYLEMKERPPVDPKDSVLVESDWLPHINLRSATGADLGLLREDKLRWPLLLRGSDFTTDRELVEKLYLQVKREVAKGDVPDANAVKLMVARVDVMQEQLKKTVQDGKNVDPSLPRNYIPAKQFLNQLEKAVQALDLTDAAFYLQTVKGGTVSEIVQFLKRQGTTFGPSTPGGERYYVALHSAFVDEVMRLRALNGVK